MNLPSLRRKTESRSDPALSLSLAFGLALGRVVVLMEELGGRLRAAAPSLMCIGGCVSVVAGVRQFSGAASLIVSGVLVAAVGALLAYERGNR